VVQRIQKTKAPWYQGGVPTAPPCWYTVLTSNHRGIANNHHRQIRYQIHQIECSLAALAAFEQSTGNVGKGNVLTSSMKQQKKDLNPLNGLIPMGMNT
jgi:hypothetical protein